MNAPYGVTVALTCTLAAIIPACVDTELTADLPPLDAARYETEVQPYVARACATLDCHGDRGRPLRLYSELGLRQQDSLRRAPIDDVSDPVPLTEPELRANVDSFAAFVLDDGDGELLPLSKPLARSRRGAYHVGGTLFTGIEHPGHVCLERWLLGLDDDADADACFTALSQLE